MSAEHVGKALIKEQAKQLVLQSGPSNVLEFGSEIIVNVGVELTYGAEVAELILDEARRQAVRVYYFLGYEPPWAAPTPLAQRPSVMGAAESVAGQDAR